MGDRFKGDVLPAPPFVSTMTCCPPNSGQPASDNARGGISAAARRNPTTTAQRALAKFASCDPRYEGQCGSAHAHMQKFVYGEVISALSQTTLEPARRCACS